MIAKLINRLHRVFDKEPRPIPVLTVSTPCIITMSNAVATVLVNGSTHTIATDGMTLSQFVTALGTKGVTATLTSGAYQILIARGVLDTHRQDTTVDNHVYYSGNLFWQEMQVYGWMLQEQSDRLLRAEQQLYLHSAENEWLDYWLKDYFGILRDTSESDAQYKDRAIAEIIRIKQNNKAMEIALKNAVAAVDCIVRDADITNGMSLQYDGTALYVGNDKYAYKYGSQPGCFYITTDLPSEDARTLDQITKTLVGTANKIKAAGTKLDGVVYKTSTSDIAIISEATALTAKDTQTGILPWGLRYDGSVSHSSGRNLLFDGSDTYNGAVPYTLAVDGDTTYSNAWDSAATSVRATAADRQTVQMRYDGITDFDGLDDFGSVLAPVKEGREKLSIKRHYLYDGKRTYGSAKSYNGNWGHNGELAFALDAYCGIHEIKSATPRLPDCTIGGDAFNTSDADSQVMHVAQAPDLNMVVRRFDGTALFNAALPYFPNQGTVVDGAMSISITQHHKYNGRSTHGAKDRYDGGHTYNASARYGLVIRYQKIEKTVEVMA